MLLRIGRIVKVSGVLLVAVLVYTIRLSEYLV
jgi:hypothetical protein